MDIGRRHFIQTSAAAAVAVTILGTEVRSFGQTAGDDLFFPPPESTLDPLNYFSSRHFQPLVGGVFQGEGEFGSFDFRLLEVKQLESKSNLKRGYTGESFSLYFEAEGKTLPPSGTYDFDHPALGRFSLFVGPVGMSNNCEAIVNRISRPF